MCLLIVGIDVNCEGHINWVYRNQIVEQFLLGMKIPRVHIIAVDLNMIRVVFIPVCPPCN